MSGGTAARAQTAARVCCESGERQPESLSSPSAALRVRDLHVNGRLLSAGEPEEEQRLLVDPHTAFASPPLLHLQARPAVRLSVRAGRAETDMSCVAGAGLLCV